MENKLSIYSKLSKIQSELKAPKGQFNNFGNYKYRSCEDILEALKPLLQKYNLAILISDRIINLGDRFYVEAKVELIDTESNESVETRALAREEENKKGMDSSQITGSSSSYARKYALNGMFAIDDNKDSDTTNTHDVEEVQKAYNDTKKELTGGQIKRLYAIAYKVGYGSEAIQSHIYNKYQKEIKNLTKEEYDYICDSLNKKGEKVV